MAADLNLKIPQKPRFHWYDDFLYFITYLVNYYSI